MAGRKQHWKKVLRKGKRGMRGHPMASIALYGPNESRATKLVVSILAYPDAEPEPMRKWFSDTEIRSDDDIVSEVLGFLTENGVRSVVAMNRLIGCPHEEVIDYPRGEECPQCPFWHGIDRWTGKRMR